MFLDSVHLLAKLLTALRLETGTPAAQIKRRFAQMSDGHVRSWELAFLLTTPKRPRRARCPNAPASDRTLHVLVSDVYAAFRRAPAYRLAAGSASVASPAHVARYGKSPK